MSKKMKKSQIFLGASAFILAIAGAMATKASHRSITYTYGTKYGSNNVNCHKLTNTPLLTTIQTPGLNLKAHTSISNFKTLYTAVTDVNGITHCGRILYTQGKN